MRHRARKDRLTVLIQFWELGGCLEQHGNGEEQYCSDHMKLRLHGKSPRWKKAISSQWSGRRDLVIGMDGNPSGWRHFFETRRFPDHPITPDHRITAGPGLSADRSFLIAIKSHTAQTPSLPSAHS